MKIKTFIIIFTIAFNIISCNSSQKSKSHKVIAIGDSSMNALDWNGNYQGIIPCADCEGIKTQLTLNNDLTYILQTQYLGKEDSVFQATGKFSWNDKGNSVTLDNENKQKYFVGENQVLHLNNNGNKITSDLAEKYILKKEKVELAGKYWKLFRLNGKDVKIESKEPNLTFEEENNRASGNGGCNQFSCSFELQESNRIKFGIVMSTKMACIGDWNENDFFQVLEKTTQYSLSENELFLQDDYETTLAIFKSDFFK